MDRIGNSAIKKLNTVFAVDTEDPTIKNFIEQVHKAVLQKAQESQDRDNGKNEKSIILNRTIKLFCENINLYPRRCAEMLNEKYGYNFTGDDIIDSWNYQRIKGQTNRLDILLAVSNEVESFIRALVSKSPEDRKALQEAYMNSMKKCYKDSDREKFSRRIFFLMLYTKYPALNIYNDFETFELFGNTQAKFIYSVMYNCLRIAYGEMDERQQENERLKSALQNQETDRQNLKDNFDAEIQEKMSEFFSLLNSNKYGNILDSIMKLYNGVMQLRKQNIELPLEISDIRPLLNNFRQFGKDNGINPIMKIGSVHSMTAADINKFSGDYDGTPFADANEIKTVRVISPGWQYKDVKISPPKFKEEKVEVVEQNE